MSQDTANARISARGAYLIFQGERKALIRRGGTYFVYQILASK